MIQTAIALFIGLSASFFIVRALAKGVAAADWRTGDDATLSFEKEREPLNYWGLIGLLALIATGTFYIVLA
jgi:hypothetical protein